jgi:hypothetical protein
MMKIKSSTMPWPALCTLMPAQEHALVAWIVFRDTPDCLDKYVARLAMNQLTPYRPMAETRVDIREQLPPQSPAVVQAAARPIEHCWGQGLSYERLPAA